MQQKLPERINDVKNTSSHTQMSIEVLSVTKRTLMTMLFIGMLAHSRKNGENWANLQFNLITFLLLWLILSEKIIN